MINYTSYTTADFRWLRYIATVITLGDWFQTEYSLYTEHRKNQIESKSRFFVQNQIEIYRLAKISYRHSTTVLTIQFITFCNFLLLIIDRWVNCRIFPHLPPAKYPLSWPHSCTPTSYLRLLPTASRRENASPPLILYNHYYIH